MFRPARHASIVALFIVFALTSPRLAWACTITWDGGAGTNAWATAANWDTNVVPGPADDVCIPPGATVVFSTGTVTINSLTCNGTFTISGGTLSLATASQISGPFTLSGGTLGGAGDLTLTGASSWTAGTMSGAGATIVNPGATLTISSTSSKPLQRTLNNFGAATWSNGQIQFTNGTFNNKPGGTFGMTTSSISGQSGTNAFNNEGTCTKSTTGITNFFSNSATMAFNNLSTGTLNVTAGTLTLSEGGSNSGLIAISSTANLSIAATMVYGPASTLQGDGTVALSGGAHNLPAGTFDVTGSLDCSGAASITIIDPLALDSMSVAGGTLNVSGDPSSIADLTVSGGTLGGSAEITPTSSMTWSGGTMSGSGTTIIPANVTLVLPSTNLKGVGRTVNNFGTTTWSNGQLQFSNGTFNNKPGAVFNMSVSSMSGQSGTNAFNNEGTCTKSGTGTTDVFSNSATMAFNNLGSGVVNVNAGTLSLAEGGSNSGLITIGPTASLSLGATVIYGASSSVQGTGTVNFTGGTHIPPAGTFNITGTVNVSGPATATIIDPLSLVTLTIASGTLNVNGGPSFVTDFSLSGGTIGGSADLTVTNSMNWTAGGMAGAGTTFIPATVALAISSTNSKILNRVLNNFGPASWSNGQIQLTNGTFNNKPGATFDITGNNSMSGQSGLNAFNNEGLVMRSGTGLTQFFSNSATMAFNNLAGATVQLTGGALTLTEGGSNDGLIAVTTPAALALGGTVTHGPASSLEGNGTATIAGGTHIFPANTFNITSTANFIGGSTTITQTAAVTNSVTITGSNTIVNVPGNQTWGTLDLSSGTLSGSGNVTIANALSWTGGAMAGSGTTMIDPTATLAFSSTNGKQIQRTLNNFGAATWSEGQIQFNNSGTFNNKPGATLAISGNNSMSGTGGNCAFNNEGIVMRSGAGLTQIFANIGTLAFNNSGSVAITGGTVSISSTCTQTAGSMILNGGTLTKTGTAVALQGGVLGGVGTLSGAVSSTGGTIAPGLSPGLFTIAGNLTRGSASTLDVELGGLAPGTQYDQLNIGGTATLGGTLRLMFVSGFVPHHGDTFTVLTAGTRAGTFSAIDVLGYPDCVASAQYTPTSVIVQIDATPPNAVCQNISVPLDATGHVSITAAQVGGGSTDNCAIASMDVAPSSFDCSNIGPNSVTLTVKDFADNTVTCNATVTVQDVSPPIITCQNLTVMLNGSGAASITPAQVYVSGTDNCGTVNLVSVVPNTFNCSNIGANPVTLTVNDGHGNETTCHPTVTVQDTTPPTVTCQNVTLTLSAAGQASITPAQVFVSGSDNCGTVNLVSVVPNSFNCTNLGSNSVTLTVNDGHGNQATCQATVTVNPSGFFSGPVNGSWFSAGNWCTGNTPDANSDVSLNVPVIVDQLGAAARNVQILSGGDLTIGGAQPGSLTVGQSLTVESGGTLTIAAGGQLTAHDLTMQNGAILNWSGGTITIDTGNWTNPPATILNIGCGSNPATLIVINGGTVHAAQINLCALGEARGNGTLAANVNNAGAVRPGTSAGVLTIAGNYTQAAGGTLTIELGGLAPGAEYDQLFISGVATLDGTLAFELINGFAPALKDSFEILFASAVAGTFATVSGSTGMCGVIFDPTYNADSILIDVVHDDQLPDCNNNGLPDICDIDAGTSVDCNLNAIPDECDLISGGGTSHDCNANGTLDECDIASGQSEDCNLNGYPDACDLGSGASADLNGNAIPDECENFGIGDINGDGVVNAGDLLIVINHWGLCPTAPPPGIACPADIAPIGPPQGDGVVNSADLLVVINHWGPVP